MFLWSLHVLIGKNDTFSVIVVEIFSLNLSRIKFKANPDKVSKPLSQKQTTGTSTRALQLQPLKDQWD
jgi:hypothetical protein